jgi:hypothetical protein
LLAHNGVGLKGLRNSKSFHPTGLCSASNETTTIYDRRRQNVDRHAAYVVVAFVAGG